MMNAKKLRMLVLTALFAALTCVATMVIRIPTIAGYTNFGDGMVLLGAFLLGPLYGGLAGGLGSAMADLISGYTWYVPGSFLIKGLVGVFAALLIRRNVQKHGAATLPALMFAAIPSELFMAAGYFTYKAWILGKFAGAIESIPGNLMQGLAGCVISILLYRLLVRVPEVKERSWKGR